MPDRKLSVEQEEEVVQLYASGSVLSEITKAYGVNVATVYRILNERKITLRSHSVKLKPATPDMIERAFGKPKRNSVTIEDADPINETLTERKTDKKRFRVTLKVRLTFEADSLEGAVAKSKGYNGFQEVLSVTRVG